VRRVDQSAESFHPVELRRDDGSVGFGASITKELPDVAYLADHVQIHICNHDIVFGSFAALGDELTSWVAEVALSVKLADTPGLLDAGAIDCSDEVLIGDRMCGLFLASKDTRSAQRRLPRG